MMGLTTVVLFNRIVSSKGSNHPTLHSMCESRNVKTGACAASTPERTEIIFYVSFGRVAIYKGNVVQSIQNIWGFFKDDIDPSKLLHIKLSLHNVYHTVAVPRVYEL